MISAVADIAGRWHELGIALKLRSSDLDAILCASAQNPSTWLSEKSAYTVAETELQCMYYAHILHSESLVCPLGHNFTWSPELEVYSICPCMVNQSEWKGYGIGLHLKHK